MNHHLPLPPMLVVMRICFCYWPFAKMISWFYRPVVRLQSHVFHIYCILIFTTAFPFKAAISNNNTKKTTANRSSVVLPYYRGLSEKLQRCLNDHKITAFFKPMRTIDDKLSKWKRSCPPFWTSRRGILRTVWWLRLKVLWRNKKVIQHTQERTY